MQLSERQREVLRRMAAGDSLSHHNWKGYWLLHGNPVDAESCRSLEAEQFIEVAASPFPFYCYRFTPLGRAAVEEHKGEAR